jgi:2-oxo-4-hydroxy-4-carboxy-5-ureidoimidazoline decarboxylase
MTSLEDFNELDSAAAVQALLSCCTSASWADAVAAARPYNSIHELLTESDRAVSSLGTADLQAALAGHPRIGAAGMSEHGTGWSKQEQAGVGTADDETLKALEDGNHVYERRFGHIYLACASGRTGGELLAFLRERLDNDRETEWGVVAAELAKINQIRLRKLIGGQT